MLSPDCVTACCVTTEYVIYSTMLLILLISCMEVIQTREMFGELLCAEADRRLVQSTLEIKYKIQPLTRNISHS